MSWVRVDSNLHTHPRLRRAGPLAACVFEAVLRLVKEHGKGGVIAADCVTPEDVALFMGWPGWSCNCDDFIGWVKQALDGLMRVGLVTPPDSAGKIAIPSWSKYQQDATGAERQAAFRARQHDVASVSNALRNGSNASNDNGTGRDGTGLLGPPPTEESLLSGSPQVAHPTNGKAPPWTDCVDQVIEACNRVLDTKYRTGPHRNKAFMALIRPRLEEEAAALDGDRPRAVKRAVCVVEALWREWKDDPKMRGYLTPGTLFRPERWPERVEKGRQWWEEWGRLAEVARATPAELIEVGYDAYNGALRRGLDIEAAHEEQLVAEQAWREAHPDGT